MFVEMVAESAARVAVLGEGPALAFNVLDAKSWAGLGVAGVFVAMFVETGLLVGFFLPGDSLLFTAGVFTATSAGSGLHLSLPAVLVAAAVGAVLGAQVGYLIGTRGGTALLRRVRNRHLHRGVEQGSRILARYGHGKAVVLARFVPVVRTVLNPLAGISGVPARVFLLWQVVGGLVWTVGVTLAGHFLGAAIPGVDQYLLPIVAVVIVISVIPVLIELLRARRTARESHR